MIKLDPIYPITITSDCGCIGRFAWHNTSSHAIAQGRLIVWGTTWWEDLWPRSFANLVRRGFPNITTASVAAAFVELNEASAEALARINEFTAELAALAEEENS